MGLKVQDGCHYFIKQIVDDNIDIKSPVPLIGGRIHIQRIFNLLFYAYGFHLLETGTDGGRLFDTCPRFRDEGVFFADLLSIKTDGLGYIDRDYVSQVKAPCLTEEQEKTLSFVWERYGRLHWREFGFIDDEGRVGLLGHMKGKGVESAYSQVICDRILASYFSRILFSH